MTAPEPALPQPPAPRPAARLRHADGGGCFDCRPGEAALSVDATAAPAPSPGPACPADATQRIESVAERLATAAGGTLAAFYGPLVDAEVRDGLSAAPAGAQEELAGLLADLVSAASPCRLLALVLPRDAAVAGFRYEARDAAGGGDCLPGQECPIGQARWPDGPARVETARFTVVYALFLNASPDRERHPRLTVYLRAPG